MGIILLLFLCSQIENVSDSEQIKAGKLLFGRFVSFFLLGMQVVFEIPKYTSLVQRTSYTREPFYEVQETQNIDFLLSDT